MVAQKVLYQYVKDKKKRRLEGATWKKIVNQSSLIHELEDNRKTSWFNAATELECLIHNYSNSKVGLLLHIKSEK